MESTTQKLEGFDPSKHRMLEDGKSWVLKEVPKKDTPADAVFEYNEFAKEVAEANSGLTPQQAIDKIYEVEKKNGHKFFGITTYPTSTNRPVFERRRLSALEDLNLLTKEGEKDELDKLRLAFQQTIDEIVKETGDSATEIQKAIDSLIITGLAQNLVEAEKIIIEGPVIQGFEETQDPKIPNEVVEQFLLDAFGAKTLRKATIGRVTKDDKYLIHRSFENPQYTMEGNELLKKGLAKWESGFLLAEDKEHYLQAEMYLERISDPQKLRHIYKLKASKGSSIGFGEIQLRSFGIEKSTDLDYLSDVPLETEEDKMRAYILGVLGHEVAHRYQYQTDESVFTSYKQLMEEEEMPGKGKYVSDYVRRHKEVYGSDASLIFREDFADAVRIYLTNPNYLQTNFPRRYAFIKENFPFIKEGAVIDAVKSIQEEH